MKTTSVLTRLIPAISALQGATVFNIAIKARLVGFLEEVRNASNEDRIIVNDLMNAISKMIEAESAETQQKALTALIYQADKLLDQISSGNPPHADYVPLTVEDLISKIANDMDSIQDVFSPKNTILRRIRKNASEMVALINAEVMQKIRPVEHMNYANNVFESADNLETPSYHVRERHAANINTYVKLLAA